jgi:hypothetical protein
MSTPVAGGDNKEEATTKTIADPKHAPELRGSPQAVSWAEPLRRHASRLLRR